MGPRSRAQTRPDEDVTVTARSRGLLQVTRDVVEQLGREGEGDGTHPVRRLRALVEEPPAPQLGLSPTNGDGQSLLVEVPPPQGRRLPNRGVVKAAKSTSSR